MAAAPRLCAVAGTAIVCALLFAGCGTVPVHPLAFAGGERDILKESLACDNRLVLVSAQEFRSGRPVLVLIHGATHDPTEMMAIAREFLATHNVYLYSYNYHRPVERVARDFVRELTNFRAAHPEPFLGLDGKRGFTVVSYSYSALVFRKAVLLSHAQGLFSEAWIVQLVPTVAGSFLARGMGGYVAASLVALASNPSAAENPYGSLAEELWGSEGNRKFYDAIDARRLHTVLVEDDPHSVLRLADREIQQRYQNGLGPNVVIIPKRVGATHENIPTHPATLAHLRRMLGPGAGDRAGVERMEAPPVGKPAVVAETFLP